MHMLTVLAVTLLVGFVCTYPSITDDINKVIVTKDILSESLLVYEGEHEIVKIFVPLNKLNYGSSGENLNYLYFFVEADDNEYGGRSYKGLYVVKDGIPKKILDNGRDATAANDDSEDVFLAGEDGIYRYNDVKESAEKYGSVKESIIGIEKATGRDLIYILTENGEVYKVTRHGNKKNLIKEIVGAKQILLDYENNLYYVDYNNQIYAYSNYGLTKINGIPEHSENVRLLKPPFTIPAEIPFLADNNLYVINENEGGVEHVDVIEFTPDSRPSALAMEIGEVLYYAVDKKIYRYNLNDIAWFFIEAIFQEIKKLIRLI